MSVRHLQEFISFEFQFLHVQPIPKAAKKVSAEIWGYALWVCGVGDWEKNGEGAKKQNFLERKGPIKVLKHCCFLLTIVKNVSEIKIPREVKTSILTNYMDQ